MNVHRLATVPVPRASNAVAGTCPTALTSHGGTACTASSSSATPAATNVQWKVRRMRLLGYQVPLPPAIFADRIVPHSAPAPLLLSHPSSQTMRRPLSIRLKKRLTAAVRFSFCRLHIQNTRSGMISKTSEGNLCIAVITNI